MMKKSLQLLDVNARKIFCQFTAGKNFDSCERSWANLQLYNKIYFWQYYIENGRMWIVSTARNYMFFPLGDSDLLPEEFAGILREFSNICSGSVICGDIPEDYPLLHPDVDKYFEFDLDPGDFDYIYDLQKICDFQGARLRKRHNHVRQFDREYDRAYCVESITSEMLPEVFEFAEKLSFQYWQSDSGLEEKSAMIRLFELWNDPACGLDGVLLRIAGEIAGFSIYSALSPILADIHFEKADRTFTGCGTKLTAVLAEHLLKKGFKEMNREQDLNIDGLRRAKQALDPVRFCRRLSLQAE